MLGEVEQVKAASSRADAGLMRYPRISGASNTLKTWICFNLAVVPEAEEVSYSVETPYAPLQLACVSVR